MSVTSTVIDGVQQIVRHQRLSDGIEAEAQGVAVCASHAGEGNRKYSAPRGVALTTTLFQQTLQRHDGQGRLPRGSEAPAEMR